MEPIGADAERSLRRSRVRTRVLLMLSSLSEAYPRQLARAAGVDSSRIHWIMHGRLPYYDPQLSLVQTGLAREMITPTGRVYVITRKGRRKARSLTSRKRPRGNRLAYFDG